MYITEILSGPSGSSMEKVEITSSKQVLHGNGMSASTYSHYDSGICPDGVHFQRHAYSSPEEGDLPRLLSRHSFTMPARHAGNVVTTKEVSNGSCTYSLNRNCSKKPTVERSTPKQGETQLFFPPLRHRRKSNSHRNCVLCILITAIVIFALLVTLLIGQWASDGYLSQFSANGVQDLNSIAHHKNFSVFEVYPPVFNEDYAPAIHRTANSRSPEDPIIVLPKNVLPVHYDLILDFTEFSTGEHIHGNISVLFESFGNSTEDEIVFHAASNIFIHRLRIRRDGRPIGIRTVKRQFKRDLVKVQLKQRLKATWYTLELEFRTRICQSALEGAQCMKSLVPNSTSEVVTGFATKFEPVFARTFLPCWDEPGIKTTFNMSIKHLKNSTVLTNAERQDGSKVSNSNSNVQTTHFIPTPKMPIYLLAFVVGDYVPLEMRTDRNMPLTMWVAKEDVAASHFAANFSPVMFDRIEEDFGVLYPMSKMDFVAVKGFPVGGMENFGLVIYNDQNILLPPTFINEKNVGIDGIFEQYRIEKIITHEIVHQWFGNLVTMHDWPELWLNEGFASYFVYDFLNDNHPHLTDNEYYIRLIELLDRQTSISRIPLVRNLETVEEIDKMFDGLQLYTKGAVVVKMIKDLLGSFDFRAGISRYLKKNAYKSVTKDNLWASLPTYADHGAENERLEDVMESWLMNKGMPEVIISRNYEDHTIRITQRVCDQNRYIIYLNDATFITQGPKTRTKRASSDEIFREIAEDDRLVDILDEEGFKRTRNDSFEGRVKSLRMKTTNVQRIKSGEQVFDDSFFYVESTTTSDVESSSVMNKEKSSVEALKIQAFLQNSSKENEIIENKVPLFTNHLKDSKKSRITKLRQRIKSKEHFTVESEYYRRQIRRKIHSSSTTWSIPFSYWFGSTQSNVGQTVRQFWIHNETIRFVDAELNANEYILANPHWVYPFKINYDLDNWKMLIEQLHKHPEEIASMSRAQLIVDAETYLKQSGVPYLYVKLLRYLEKETDLGVLLIGLDAVYSLIDMFSSTMVNGPILVYLTPVLQKFDKMLEKTSNDPELAAVWLLSPQRLSKLFQLRCIANFGSCQQNQQVEQWLAFPTALSAEHHQQITAICHYLFTQSGPKEIALLAGLLRQKTTQWAVILQLATCVRDETLIEEAVTRIVKSRNAVVYATVLQGSYSVQYNQKFREVFWKGIASLSLHERQMLFAVNTGKSDRIAQLLLHSMRTCEELEAVVQLLPEWPPMLQIHIDYIRRKFFWIEKTAVKQIQNFLIQESV